MQININKQDIDKYMLIHKNDGNIKYREALFLKYLNDTDNKTFEKAEMYLKKIKDKEEFYRCYDVFELFNFNKYIELISSCRNIDIYDISLMLVPALGQQELYAGDIKIGYKYIQNFSYLLDMDTVSLINGAVYSLRNYSKEYDNSYISKIDLDIKRIGILNDTLGNYVRLRKLGIIEHREDDFTLIGKERCEKELEKYSEIYGEEQVEIIKEYAKRLK